MGKGTEAANALHPDRPAILVVATTGEGTQCALRSAKRLAAPDARVRVIVPQLTSIGDAPMTAEDERRAVDACRDLAKQAGISASVISCVCRRYDDVRSLLDPASLLIIGGQRRALWPTREQRFADRLAAAGYSVVFAQPAELRTDSSEEVLSS
jgi:hypothetical protein